MDDQYMMLSSDLRNLLVQNGMTIDDVVQRAGAPLLKKTSDPTIPAGTRADPVTLLIASAAVVATATPLVQKILATLTHRPIVVKERELVAVVDGRGVAVTDQSGAPILAWREKHKLLEPKADPDSAKTTVKGFGIEIGLG